MCLSKITKRYEEGNNIEGFGWVVMNKAGENYTPWLYDLSHLKFKPNKEYRRVQHRGSWFNGEYKMGFHVWKLKKHAEQLLELCNGGNIVVKVKYREIICSGLNDYGCSSHGNCIVVKYRTIIEEV